MREDILMPRLHKNCLKNDERGRVSKNVDGK